MRLGFPVTIPRETQTQRARSPDHSRSPPARLPLQNSSCGPHRQHRRLRPQPFCRSQTCARQFGLGELELDQTSHFRITITNVQKQQLLSGSPCPSPHARARLPNRIAAMLPDPELVSPEPRHRTNVLPHAPCLQAATARPSHLPSSTKIHPWRALARHRVQSSDAYRSYLSPWGTMGN